ncbi:MAG: HAD family hydrolase [Gammaproteobacteria bacterium]|nr:HAD family hydrolase [Gammaproteobacteria bacterium]MBL6999829.1 HAD family hydrolase [Gammaproteobacteria bacterium]
MFDSVSVIAFDLDDTLWPCMPTIQRAEKATYAWLQQGYPRITQHYSELGLFEFRKAFMNSNESYKVDLSLMRRAMLAQLAQDFDYDAATMAEQGFQLFYHLRHDVSFYEDVFPVLDRLKGRYRLGSISNGNASAGLTPLNDYFDFFINAADVMARKPDRRIFHSFCDNLQVSPEHCLYVGDDPGYDVVGARAAGMQTIWVNRQNSEWPVELAPAQAEISNLYQLLDLLEAVPVK